MATSIDEGKSRQLFELLKETLELPKSVISFELRMGVGEPTTVECKYYPEIKDNKK